MVTHSLSLHEPTSSPNKYGSLASIQASRTGRPFVTDNASRSTYFTSRSARLLLAAALSAVSLLPDTLHVLGTNLPAAGFPHASILPSTLRACVTSQRQRLRNGGIDAALAPRAARGQSRAAVAIPAHAPTFGDVLRVLRERAQVVKSGGELDWDLFVTFTRESDAAFFAALAAADADCAKAGVECTETTLFYQALVVEWWAAPAAINASLNTYGIVTLKHFTALAVLHPCYDVIATPDAEISTRGRVGAALLARSERLNNVLAGYNPLSRCNMRRAIEFVPADDVEALRSLTRDFTLYSWWSDVPVYRSVDVVPFFKWKRFPELVPTTAFAYLAYDMWRILQQGAVLVDMRDAADFHTCSSLEFLANDDEFLRVAAAFPPGPAWLSAAFCERVPARCEQASLVFHTDRTWAGILELPGSTPCLVESVAQRVRDDACWITVRVAQNEAAQLRGALCDNIAPAVVCDALEYGERDARDEYNRLASCKPPPRSGSTVDFSARSRPDGGWEADRGWRGSWTAQSRQATPGAVSC